MGFASSPIRCAKRHTRPHSFKRRACYRMSHNYRPDLFRCHTTLIYAQNIQIDLGLQIRTQVAIVPEGFVDKSICLGIDTD